MASRRLDIGSLLCDDNQPAFSPLEVLVQAATEERKRLGAADDPQQHRQNTPSDTRQSPVNDNHVTHSPCLSPHLSRYHTDDSQRIHLPQQPLYLQRVRPHHDNLSYPQYQHQSPSSRDFDFSLEADRRRRLQEAEHQQRLQKQRIQELEYQRQQEQERAYRAQELERQRREEDHLRALEYQRELECREAERLQQLLAEEKRRELEEKRQSERQFEIERHRAATEKQHSQQFERRSFFDMHPQQFAARLSPVLAPAAISHLVSNSDPPQITQPTSSISPDSIPPSQHDPRPIKKRRYSVSPVRYDDQERIAHDRDRMVAGELGYGRVDSPVVGPSAPRRPGSHNQPRKVVAVADLLADKEPPPSPVSQLARPDPRDSHKTLSPTSRRSPPGSQIGRAKAARKSDEYIASLREPVQPPPPTTKEHLHSPTLPESTKVTEDVKVKQEPRSNRLHYISDETRQTPTIDESRQKNAPPPPALKIQSSNSKSMQRDDPHEFFLHQYDQVPTPAKSAKSTHPDPAGMPSPSTNPISPTPSVIAPKGLPAATAVVALDKELEDLISSPTSSHAPTPSSATTVKVKEQEESDDMDLAVDLAVTALVENVENDDEKHVGMEVDVEDELLSLVDDRPPPIATSLRRPSAQQQQTMGRNPNNKPHPSPPTTPIVSASVHAVGSIVRSSPARATADRDSVPPRTTIKSTKKATERADSTVPTEPSSMTSAPGKKKKETTVKASNARSKAAGSATTKSKAKTSTKVKKVAAETNTTTAAGKATPPFAPKVTKGGKKTTGSASGSRSASVVPGGTPTIEVEAAKAAKEEEEEEADNDDKLYCLCKTKYDESRLMIACDKCDEWYHTLCVNMPDLDVDLVDQFFCPSCIEKHPQSNLQTTYKQRCLWGLRHPNPDSPKACHKAARGAFSKYCSDECGIKYMQTRVDNWAKKGGKTDKLWESVKNAERREGIVVCAVDSTKLDTELDADGHTVKPKIVRPSKTKIVRETERLNNLLSSIVKIREDIQLGMEIIVCRERLLQLASERAEQVGQCGWDQRLCCDDEELADIGTGMLESYEDAKVENVKEDGDTDMEVDGHDEQWWCPGKKICDRHAGWQTIRYKDVCKEKEMKEEALAKLTLRERDLRKHIEDINDPPANNTKETKSNGSSIPLQSTTKLVNGHTKSKPSTTEKKGKKRKAPSS